MYWEKMKHEDSVSYGVRNSPIILMTLISFEQHINQHSFEGHER